MPEFADVEWIAKAEGVQVRVLALGPQRGTPWHFHSTVTDHVFALEDGLLVDLRDPAAQVPLAAGQRIDIAPGRVHRVSNRTAGTIRYLLVQATGPYDFNEVS
jgi:mannose-6-phosphate isomerase-like protein (cupin superfamily)